MLLNPLYTAPLPAGFTSGTVEIKSPGTYVDAAGRVQQPSYRFSINADGSLTSLQVGGTPSIVGMGVGDRFNAPNVDVVIQLNVAGAPVPLRSTYQLSPFDSGSGTLKLQQASQTAPTVITLQQQVDLQTLAATAQSNTSQVSDALDLSSFTVALIPVALNQVNQALASGLASVSAATGTIAYAGGDHTTLPAGIGLYRIVGSSAAALVEAGQIWERTAGGVARRSELEALADINVTDRLVADTLAVLSLAAGRKDGDTRSYRGRTYWWNSTSTEAADGYVVLAATGTPTGRWVIAAREQGVNVKWFGAVGDGVTNDAPAIQQALNYINNLGGGTLIFPTTTANTYLCNNYSSTLTGNRLLYSTLPDATQVGHIQVGGRTTINGIGNPTLMLHMTSASPYGYGLSPGILTTPAGIGAENIEYTVTAVTRASGAHSVTVSATITTMAAGDTVALGRKNYDAGGGKPGTASREIAPVQYLQVLSVSGSTVTFKDAFMHEFEQIDVITLRNCTRAGGYPRDITFDGLTIATDPTTAFSYYCLFSQTVGLTMRSVQFKGSGGGSFASSQRAHFERCEFRNYLPGKNNAWANESSSDVVYDHCNFYGAGSSGGFNGLVVQDNARRVTVRSCQFFNFPVSALLMHYSVEGMIQDCDFWDCGTTTDDANLQTVSYASAVSIGFPMYGAHPDTSYLLLNAYKKWQTPNSVVVITNTRWHGATQSAIRASDTDLTLRNCIINGTQVAGNNQRIVWVGETGSMTADATFQPYGGRARLTIDGLDLNISPALSPAYFIKMDYGITGMWVAPLTTVAVATLATDTTVTLVDASQLIGNQGGLYFSEPGRTTPQSNQKALSSISGNVVTLASAIGFALPVGSVVHGARDIPAVAQRSRFSRVVANGAEFYSPYSWVTSFRDMTGSPAQYALNVPLSGEGNWEVVVRGMNNDGAHTVYASYAVQYTTANGTYPVAVATQVYKSLGRTNMDIVSATVTAGAMTVTFQAPAAIRAKISYTVTKKATFGGDFFV